METRECASAVHARFWARARVDCFLLQAHATLDNPFIVLADFHISVCRLKEDYGMVITYPERREGGRWCRGADFLSLPFQNGPAGKLGRLEKTSCYSKTCMPGRTALGGSTMALEYPARQTNKALLHDFAPDGMFQAGLDYLNPEVGPGDSALIARSESQFSVRSGPAAIALIKELTSPRWRHYMSRCQKGVQWILADPLELVRYGQLELDLARVFMKHSRPILGLQLRPVFLCVLSIARSHLMSPTQQHGSCLLIEPKLGQSQRPPV